MDRRPKKLRLSDVNRKNVNMNKCISKIEGAPSDFTLIAAEGTQGPFISLHNIFSLSPLEKLNLTISRPFLFFIVDFKAGGSSFWETGDIKAEWLTLSTDGSDYFSNNREPVAPGSQKKPQIVKSGTC